MRRSIAAVAAAALFAALAPAPAAATAGALEGRVTGAGGAPVADAGVHVLPASDDPACPSADPACPAPVAATAADDGTWRVDGLDEGAYHVHAADPSGDRAPAWWGGDPPGRLDVADGTTRADLALPPAARVSGAVLGHEDRPVADATVGVRLTPFHKAQAVTDDGGSFALGGLPAGAHDLEVTPPPAGLEDGVVAVEVEEGETDEVVVRLELRAVEVLRVAGATRTTTAVASARAGFPSAEQVVIAAAERFPDALSAAPLAAAVGGPVLLVGDRLPSGVLAELERLGAAEAVVVGGVGAVPLAAELDLERAGIAVRRIAGQDRYDTSALVAAAVGAPGGEALVASGTRFPDALSAAPLAAAAGMPILLTPAGGLTPDVVDALAALGVERTTVAGGPAVVGDAVLDALPSPRRVAGDDRYATSAALAALAAERGLLGLDAIGVATGRAFPDALSAGPVAARLGMPLLLVDGADPDRAPAARAFLREHVDAIGAVWVWGGEAAVSPGVVEQVAADAGGAR